MEMCIRDRFKHLKELGFSCLVLSNNKEPRVKSFAKQVGIKYIYLSLIHIYTADRIIAESTGTSTCASYKRLCIHQRASQVKNALW